jgi:hypothetical protein
MYMRELITNVGLIFFHTLMGYTSSSKPHKHQTEVSLVRHNQSGYTAKLFREKHYGCFRWQHPHNRPDFNPLRPAVRARQQSFV